MGAFQTGFQIGSSAAQAALDRREREERIKREEEERKLRLRQLELGIAEAERRAENNRRADLIDADIVRGVGIDPGPAPEPPQRAAPGAAPAVSQGAPVVASPESALRRAPASAVVEAAPTGQPASWDQMTPEQQAQWYRENPRASAFTRGLQHLWLNGTSLGQIQRMADPVGVGRAVAVADGDVGFFRRDAARPSAAVPQAAGAAPSAQALQGAATPASAPAPAQAGAAQTVVAASPQPEAPRPRYSDKAMSLFRLADSARLRGDRAQFQSLFQQGQEQVIDDVVTDFRNGYDGAQAQVDKAIELLNANSASISIGDADPKTGIRQASIVQPDKRALFMKLSRADQAELWAAGQLMQTNPDRAFKMIAGVNKTLAEVVKADNEQARAVLTANNQGAAYGANVRRDEAYIDNLARDDRRAVAAAAKADSDAKAKADAAVALFRQRNPSATEAEVEAVRRGVISAAPTSNVESSFTPNPLGGGGTVTQRQNDGRVTLTPISPQGALGEPVTVNPPGATRSAPSAPGAGGAGRPGMSAVDPARAGSVLSTITTSALEETARTTKPPLPVDEVMRQVAERLGMSVDQLRAVVYANDARTRPGAQGAAPAPLSAAPAAAPAPPAAVPPVAPVPPVSGAIAPGVDLGPSRIPARPVPAAPAAVAPVPAAPPVAMPPPATSPVATPAPSAGQQAPLSPASMPSPARSLPVPRAPAPGAENPAESPLRPAAAAPSPPPSPAPSAAALPASAPIQISFRDAPAAFVARAVATATGRRIRVDDDVTRKVTVSAHTEETPDQAYQRFIDAVGRAGLIVLNQRDGSIRIANPPRR